MSEFGKELISDLTEAVLTNDKGRLVRPLPSYIKQIRLEQEMTQEKFATEYKINLETLKSWEQGKRVPDSVSTAYLLCIQKKPETIREILHSVL